MLDWIRYFPLAFKREMPKKPVTPKGPYFSKMRPQHWIIGDNRFAFKAPWANSIFGPSRYSAPCNSITPADEDALSFTRRASSLASNANWESSEFYHRDWMFVGPWFSGVKANLSMTAGIVRAWNTNVFDEANFFHPRVFESVIADFLNSRYGDNRVGRRARYCGPMNWRVVELSPGFQAAVFDIYDEQFGSEHPYLKHYVVFPCGLDCFVKIVFDFGGARLFLTEDQSLINFDPLFKLRDDVVETFSLRIGSQTQQMIDSVKKDCPDMTLTESFGELEWPTKRVKSSKKKTQEKEIAQSGNFS